MPKAKREREKKQTSKQATFLAEIFVSKLTFVILTMTGEMGCGDKAERKSGMRKTQ
jgi:hypothetical protein